MKDSTLSKIRQYSIMWLALAAASVLLRSVYAQEGLSPSAQADLLRDQIYAQAKANDTEALLSSLDQYRKLNIAYPTPLLWIEAKAAHQSGDAKRALQTLTAYLNRSDHDPVSCRE